MWHLLKLLKRSSGLKVSCMKYVLLDENIFLYSDIQLCKTLVFHDRSNHIDVSFHYIRDVVEKEIVFLKKILTEYNHVDVDTKSTC